MILCDVGNKVKRGINSKRINSKESSMTLAITVCVDVGRRGDTTQVKRSVTNILQT